MPYPDLNHFQTPLKRAHGLGSSRTGSHEWFEGRVSAGILLPLALWLFYSFVTMARTGMDYDAMLSWVQKPYHAFPLLLFFVVYFYHVSIGGKDVMMDYLHDYTTQGAGLLAFRVFCFGLMILSLFSVLYITFKL